jgi:hypothetical protein
MSCVLVPWFRLPTRGFRGFLGFELCFVLVSGGIAATWHLVNPVN